MPDPFMPFPACELGEGGMRADGNWATKELTNLLKNGVKDINYHVVPQ